jgi:hypothetical protein
VAAPYVVLEANVPRTELLREGFSQTKVGIALRGARFDGTVYRAATSWREGIWQEPETGIIMLRPNFMRYDWSAAKWNSYRYRLTDFRTGTNDFEEVAATVAGANGMYLLRTKKTGVASAFANITGLTADLSGFSGFSSTNAWTMQTNTPLSLNEGFGVSIAPSGVPMDKVGDYLWIAFGGRWLLKLAFTSESVLYENMGSAASPTWVVRTAFSASSAGISHSEPFTLAVIPFATNHLAIVLSQFTGVGRSGPLSSSGIRTGGIVYRINANREDDDLVPYDADLHQYIKTETGHITIGMVRTGLAYNLSVFRVAYESDIQALAPEELAELLASSNPVPYALGLTGQRVSGATTGATIDTELLDEGGLTFTPSTERRFVVRHTLSPSSDAKYSPELWGSEVVFDAVTHEPLTEDDVADYTDYVQKIEFDLTSEPGGTRLHAMVTRDPAEYDNLFKLDGSLSLTVEGATVWEGYIETIDTAIEGYTPSDGGNIRSQIEATDMWDRLDGTPLVHFRAATDQTFSEYVIEAIARAGMACRSDSAVLDGQLFYDGVGNEYRLGVEEPGEWLSASGEASVGNFLRRLFDEYGMQNRSEVRLYWDPSGPEWVLDLAPEYDSTSPPTTILFLDSSVPAIMEGAAASTRYTDTQRFDGSLASGRRYLAATVNQDDPNFTTRRPNFNALTCYAIRGQGNTDVDMLVATIPPHPDALTDSAFVDFEGRRRPSHTGARLVDAKTLNALERATRAIYDKEGKHPRVCSFFCEWRPWLETDDFVAVVGRNAAGDYVSYGAYRVERLSVELDADEASGTSVGRSHHWSALAHLRYMGVAEYGTVEMFTAAENLP